MAVKGLKSVKEKRAEKAAEKKKRMKKESNKEAKSKKKVRVRDQTSRRERIIKIQWS